MNWSNGFSSRYYYTIVDAPSWRDLERNELTAGSISRTQRDLMQSADVEMTDLPAAGEVWIRIWLDARQGQDGAHEALFTGLLSAPSTEWDGRRNKYNTECYSVLKPAADILLPRGWYAPAGQNGAALAANLLRAGPAPVSYAGSAPRLSSAIVAEDNETNLSMAWKIVNAIGWQIQINGMGEIEIGEKDPETGVIFDALENDSFELSVTDTYDWFSCPNVFRASYNELVAVARDDDPESSLSTVSRGREIWKAEQNCKLNDGESIEQYAARRLKEEQSPARAVSYTRRYDPSVLPGGVIEIHYPEQAIEGRFRVTNQQIELGYGARVSEEAEAIMEEISGATWESTLIDDTGNDIITSFGDDVLTIKTSGRL